MKLHLQLTDNLIVCNDPHCPLCPMESWHWYKCGPLCVGRPDNPLLIAYFELRYYVNRRLPVDDEKLRLLELNLENEIQKLA